MAAIGELVVTISLDDQQFQKDLARAEAGIERVLRQMYIAEGSPNGETPEGFSAWLAAREAIYVDVPTPGLAEFVESTALGLERFEGQLERLRKGPPEEEGDAGLDQGSQ